MTLFNKIVSGLAWISAILFVAAGVMLTYEVVARYFFTKPTIWAAELSQMCLIWGSLIAMAWALRQRRHIAVDAVVNLLSPGTRRWTDTIAMVAVASLSAMVVWKGGDIFWDSFERGRTTGSMLDLPTWINELSVPFGFAFLLVQSILEAVRSATGNAPDPGHGAEGGHYE